MESDKPFDSPADDALIEREPLDLAALGGGFFLTDVPEGFRAGFVAVIGKPNVGKSTLINRMVGQKVSIVSSKPQTTRRRVLGILSRERSQIVFVDTPGIHTPRTKLGELMVQSARRSVPDADVILFVCDAAEMPGPQDEQIAALLRRQRDQPILLVLNKMDRLSPDKVESHVNAFWELVPYTEWMMTTATQGRNVEKLPEMIERLLPESPPLFPLDQVTDQTERMLAAEIIREKTLYKTRAEVPHSIAVVVMSWEERENDLIYIAATVFVEKESQKRIVIGDKGAMLKQIGSLAREELEKLLERRVYLDLWVKVSVNWRQNPGALRTMEYRQD